MPTQQVKVTDRVLLLGVDTTISENDIRKQLLKTYQGIKHIERWYYKDEDGKYEAPKDTVQVNFTSPKYAERFLQDGIVSFGNLRCQMARFERTVRQKKDIASDNGSDSQSEILTEEQQITDKILVHDVPTNIFEDDLGKELSKDYPDIKHVKRWYCDDKSETPTERVQIDFGSPKNTKTILENGYIEVGQFCFPVTALKPSMRLRRKLESHHGSDSQSEIFTEEQQITDKILVHDVSTNISDDDLKKKLSKFYDGIKYVRRWFSNDDSQTPMERVQIGFASSGNTKTILENGFINVDRFRYRVTALQPSMRLREQLESNYGSDFQSEVVTDEQEITDKILIHDVPTNITDIDLKKKLSKFYNGIKYVRRWYNNDESKSPMNFVQISFQSPENAKTILESGYIDINKFRHRVTALQPSMRLREQLENDSGSDYQPQMLTEQDILQTFEGQKQ
ncbi:unnamed protein product [Rotaria sp. Silwood1]|nr:unnamed protein product [Rotaria sp. Silwood1]